MNFKIEEIEGIGDTYKQKLNERGIYSTYDYIYEVIRHQNVFDGKLGKKEGKWFNACLYFCLREIDKDEVEVLNNIAEFKKLNSVGVETILENFNKAKEQGKINRVPTQKAILNWINESIQISNTPIIALKIAADPSEISLSKFKLRTSKKTLECDSNSGVFLVYGHPSWSLTARVIYDNEFVDLIKFPSDRSLNTHILEYHHTQLKNKQTYSLPTSDILFANKNVRVEFHKIQLEDVSEGDRFWAKSTGKQSLLISEKYVLTGLTQLHKTCLTDQSDIEVNQLYKYSNNSFEKVI